MSFKEVAVENINENFIKNIGSEWMLITAGDENKYNMMNYHHHQFLYIKFA